MKLVERVIKFFAKGLLSFLLLLLLYFVAAVIGSAIPVNSGHTEEGNIKIYLRSNGVHTDFVFPVRNEVMDWRHLVDPSHTASQKTNFKYVSFGWGDLEFYQETREWDDLKFPTAMQAVFLPTPSAMHVEYSYALRMDKPTIAINVTKEQYLKLVRYVMESFEKDDSGNVIRVENLNYNQHDAFYHATRSLHFFYTCNTWVNNGLKKAGLPACLWTPLDSGIFYQYN